jgi:probable F420-dependent oxidoreductase
MEQLYELGYYTLAGNAETPRDCIDDVKEAERLGLGTSFLSERMNFKEAATICGAVGALSNTLGIATSATNPNTRSPIVTATMCATMNRLTNGRFSLGLGSGFPLVMKGWGLVPNTMERTTDYVNIIRRLLRGETIKDHDGPAGKYPLLKLMANSVNDEVPIMSVAIGETVIEWAGSFLDGVMLHTFFTDETLARVSKAARQSAERAGRDPEKLRVWSILSVVQDTMSHDEQLLKVVARMATYLQVYGDILVKTNRWDPAVLKAFREDAMVANFNKPIDDHSTTSAELEHIASLIPQEWLNASAMGTPQQIARRIVDQFDCGADGVILHGVRPCELENVLTAYRAIRPSEKFSGRVANPAR